MAKRRGLGNPWGDAPKTGADAVAVVTGAARPEVRRSKRSGGEVEQAPAEGWAVTTFRLTRRQWDALRDAALARAKAHGRGKPDASAIVRELVDRWIISGGGK